MCAWSADGGHGGLPSIQGPDTPSLTTLYYKEKAYVTKVRIGIGYINSDHLQLMMIPKRTPITKSHTVIQTMMDAIVMYSKLRSTISEGF